MNTWILILTLGCFYSRWIVPFLEPVQCTGFVGTGGRGSSSCDGKCHGWRHCREMHRCPQEYFWPRCSTPTERMRCHQVREIIKVPKWALILNTICNTINWQRDPIQSAGAWSPRPNLSTDASPDLQETYQIGCVRWFTVEFQILMNICLLCLAITISTV